MFQIVLIVYICRSELIKKLGISIFILAVLAQSGFVALSSAFRVVFHKIEMYEAVETALVNGDFSSETDQFTEAQLVNAEWEHSKEFELNGCKYDILEVQIIDGVKVYKCINDTKESVLVNQMDKSGKVSFVLDEVLKKIQFNSLDSSETLNNVLEYNFNLCDNITDLYSFSFLKFNFRPPIN